MKRSGLRRLRAPHVGLVALYRMVRARIASAVTPESAKRNVAHHYDLDAGLFELFLDADRQYSCAYFETPEQSLEEAQRAKKRHIAAKLLLEPDLHVLDIGSGWGGLALSLAEEAGVRVTGITLSEKQLAIASAARRVTGASTSVSRSVWKTIARSKGTFDRIVSVGMFEHVGPRNYSGFFEKTAALLDRENGVMLLHSIGRTKPRF